MKQGVLVFSGDINAESKELGEWQPGLKEWT